MKQPALMAYQIFWNMVDWIYPPVCMGCGVLGESICDVCKNNIRYLTSGLCPICGYPRNNESDCKGCGNHQPNYTQLRSLAVYEGCIKESIHQLKYQNNIGVGHLFIDELVSLILANQWQIDFVIPVPLSARRQKERGYNQSGMLAYPVALKLNLQYDDKVLIRQRETSTQVELDARQRQTNLQNAFITLNNKFKDKNILIMDDVITTGATINDCARAVRISGAKEVFGISLGRAVIGDISA